MELTSQISSADTQRINEILQVIDSVFIRQCRINNYLKYIIYFSKKFHENMSFRQSLGKAQNIILNDSYSNLFNVQEVEFITACLNGRIRLILEEHIHSEQCPKFGLDCFNLVCSKLYPNFEKEKDCISPQTHMESLLSTIPSCESLYDAYCIFQYYLNAPQIKIPYLLFITRYKKTLKSLFNSNKDSFLPKAMELIDYSQWGFSFNQKHPRIDDDWLPF